MEWAQLALELVRAVAWPLAVVAALWWLREPIRERLGNVEKVSALGVDLEMATRRVEKEAREVADALVEPDKAADTGEELQQNAHDQADVRDEVHVEVTPGAGPAGPAQTVYPDPVQPQLTDGQRRAIGELVQQAAEWGRVREQAGLPVEGARLDWRDGIPTLVTPTMPGPTRSARNARANNLNKVDQMLLGSGVARRLEARVDELDKERRRARQFVVGNPAEAAAAEERYQEAVQRLFAADPESPYLP
ncbi:hypothetical protein IN07_24130 [Modestobacter caceresii]|uniref:Uncharacterized protein n=1 Tax=Modestobacter caceresii TaxID=1522368 RepID=A0A098Y052_9ACTN|nr:hypothetical protein [Modestobacter caceresii]KGH43229.1 hypothetical protein IN07_24130 [Modestobacter caceresii]